MGLRYGITFRSLSGIEYRPRIGKTGRSIGDIGSSTIVMDRFPSARKRENISGRFRRRSCAPFPNRSLIASPARSSRLIGRVAVDMIGEAVASRIDDSLPPKVALHDERVNRQPVQISPVFLVARQMRRLIARPYASPGS